MRSIETIIHIHTPLQKVWDVLMDFESYPEWNPFIISIEGIAKPGRNIAIKLKLSGEKEMAFKPRILITEPFQEFRWKGKMLINGLFDGEHYFILSDLPNGSTSLRHGENFSGLLTYFMPGLFNKTEKGFQKMNLALKERCEAQTIIG